MNYKKGSNPIKRKRNIIAPIVLPLIIMACSLISIPTPSPRKQQPASISTLTLTGKPASTETLFPIKTNEPLLIATQPSIQADGPAILNCNIFPVDNFWNTPIDSLPIHSMSAKWIKSIGPKVNFHMDFGSGMWDGGPIGIPYNIYIESIKSFYTPEFEYSNESDPGPYPIPTNPMIEYGSDHHILIIAANTCMLYEIYNARFFNRNWSAGSGSIWDLKSNDLRPIDWTSADAAGLPIFPGLVRHDEILSGEIKHALRFTAEDTAGYIWPARHQTANATDGIPPMGARFRLKAGYDITGFPPQIQIILKAMKKYGIVLADNGANWYISGAPDQQWDNDELHLMDQLIGDDFEAVDTSLMMVDPNSGKSLP